MKKIILPVAILIGYTAAAQNNDAADVLKKMMLQKAKSSDLKITPTIAPPFDIQKQSTTAYTLSNGNKVITLPQQDNMPCIVPEMKSFNMPNAALSSTLTSTKAGKMPNVADNDTGTKWIESLDIKLKSTENIQKK